MIATRAYAGPKWDNVNIELLDDHGRTVSAEMTPKTAVTLAHELAEVANGFRGNEVVARWEIGPASKLAARIVGGRGVIDWAGRHRNRIRIHPSRLREVADLLHDLADRAEG